MIFSETCETKTCMLGSLGSYIRGLLVRSNYSFRRGLVDQGCDDLVLPGDIESEVPLPDRVVRTKLKTRGNSDLISERGFYLKASHPPVE